MWREPWRWFTHLSFRVCPDFAAARREASMCRNRHRNGCCVGTVLCSTAGKFLLFVWTARESRRPALFSSQAGFLFSASATASREGCGAVASCLKAASFTTRTSVVGLQKTVLCPFFPLPPSTLFSRVDLVRFASSNSVLINKIKLSFADAFGTANPDRCGQNRTGGRRLRRGARSMFKG